MTERERLASDEQRERIYRRDGGRCVVCGASLEITTYHRAHIIPQRAHWLKRYGRGVIYHDSNMVATCPNDRCNNAVSVGNNVREVARLAALVEQNIVDGCRDAVYHV